MKIIKIIQDLYTLLVKNIYLYFNPIYFDLIFYDGTYQEYNRFFDCNDRILKIANIKKDANNFYDFGYYFTSDPQDNNIINLKKSITKIIVNDGNIILTDNFMEQFNFINDVIPKCTKNMKIKTILRYYLSVYQKYYVEINKIEIMFDDDMKIIMTDNETISHINKLT